MFNRKVFTLENLTVEFEYSKRKAQTIIKELREVEGQYGYEIETKRGEGYVYKIVDQALHDTLLLELSTLQNQDYDSQSKRVWIIISLLMFNNNFMTIQDITTIIDVSRATIIRDLEVVERLLQEYALKLLSMPYKGIKVIGNELDKRRLFMAATDEVSDSPVLYNDYIVFINNVNKEELTHILRGAFEKHQIKYSDNAYMSIVDHLQILLYRVSKNNYISNLSLDKAKIIKNYQLAGKEIIDLLSATYCISIPSAEIGFLTVQLVGKSTIETIPEAELLGIKETLDRSLKKLDSEFSTELSEDIQLKESLLYHIYPMEMRLSYGMRLESSIIDFISVEYTNSFLISLRFLEVYLRLKESTLSRDEIGYLTIHFASHFDRQNEHLRNDLRSVLVLTHNTRSSHHFTNQRLQKLFPNANIVSRSPENIKNIIFSDVDIVISVGKLNIDTGSSIVFEISEIITDKEINHIRSTLSSHVTLKRWSLRLQDLFFEELFFIEEHEDDYLKILNKYSQKFVDLGYATAEFPQSLMKREEAFTTVYDDGIAGPHSMGQTAIVESIGIIFLKKPCTYQRKTVSLILMINVKKGHIFLYQSISDFILTLIDDRALRKQLMKYPDFEQFLQLIEGVV